jgi:hypothetical protein
MGFVLLSQPLEEEEKKGCVFTLKIILARFIFSGRVAAGSSWKHWN